MNKVNKGLSVRWLYMAVGVIAMLFAGVLYAWSVLKSPLAVELELEPKSQLLVWNFTLAMAFFCIGGLLGARISKKWGHGIALIAAGALADAGFVLTSLLTSGVPIVALYLTYGVLAGLGIGIAYNVLISTVSAWFPDKKGLCSGCMMMGFGASTLILGNIANKAFDLDGFGWRGTYRVLGIAILVVFALAGIIIKKPSAEIALQKSNNAKSAKADDNEQNDFSTKQMLCNPSFWLAFICISLLAAVGNSVIGSAKDLAGEVGASNDLAVTLVGVLSVCNGVGRILTGAIFDKIGCRKTMIGANILTICSAGVTLLSVLIRSLPLGIVGMCLVGLSYGACPTVTSACTLLFFGKKHFPNNMAIMTFTVMAGSLLGTAASYAPGGFVGIFIVLLSLTVVALVLNIFIRKPKK